MTLDVSAIRRQLSGLETKVNGHPLIYLDNAATAQMPDAAWEAMRASEQAGRANVHRGMHVLAEQATQAFEDARKTVATFINAKMAAEVIFTKGCTESINIVARGSDADLQKGDAILLTLLEHHSNVVPWQQLATRTGAIMKWIEIDDEGNLNLDQYKKYVAEGNVKIVALTGQSNVLGVRPPLKEMIADAHKAGAIVLVDAAQLVAHHAIDVQDLDCDFLAFSGHKLYGPTGIGILYGKRALLEKMPPMLGGGSMISEVTKDGFKSADIPAKFEAGTPAITQAIGLRASIDWLTQYKWKEIEAHEQTLLRAALEGLQKIEGLKILGSLEPEKISGCVSFVIDGIHAHDLTEVLGRQGICLRAGHHCCQPLHDRFGITASTRLSVGIYNTVEEIQQACAAIEEARTSFLKS